MDPNRVENTLRGSLSTESIDGVEGFPYTTYAEFLSALKTGEAQVRTAYDSDACNALGTAMERVLHYSLTCAPFLLGIAVVVLAFIRSEYILLLGFPIAVLGFLLSTPGFMRRAGSLLVLIAAGAAVYNWYYGNTKAVYLWGVYAVSNFFANVAREQCAMLLRDAVGRSEIVLVWLHLKGTVSVYRT